MDHQWRSEQYKRKVFNKFIKSKDSDRKKTVYTEYKALRNQTETSFMTLVNNIILIIFKMIAQT